MLPREGSSPGGAISNRAGKLGTEYALSSKEANATYVRTGHLPKTFPDPQMIQQGQVGGGEVFTTNLAPRERFPLQEDNRPTGSCQQQGCRRPGWTAADH